MRIRRGTRFLTLCACLALGSLDCERGSANPATDASMSGHQALEEAAPAQSEEEPSTVVVEFRTETSVSRTVAAAAAATDAQDAGVGRVSEVASLLVGADRVKDEDGDGDGFGARVDCDDNDSSISPFQHEVLCDGIDQNCDGFDSCESDDDGDGWGNSSDCDDLDSTITDQCWPPPKVLPP